MKSSVCQFDKKRRDAHTSIESCNEQSSINY